jgi:protocatechuate 3,4-dioxygenase beta subunit
VTLRARELTEAALRLELSVREGPSGAAEQLPEGLLLTLQDLYFDFLGSGVRDSGWDALYRQSRQARLFGVALADVLNRERALLGLSDLLALQRSWGDTESYRADHLTVATQTAGGSVPVAIELQDGLGRKLGGSLDPEAGQRQIAGADVLTFSTAGTTTGQFAALTQLGVSPYTATLTAQHAGTFDLGIVVTGADGQLRQVTFRSLPVTQGETLRAVIRPRQDPLVVLERSGVPIAAASEDLIPDTAPRVLGVMQNGDPSVDAFGRVVAVLFSEDVELVSAQTATAYAVSPASIPMVPGPALSDGNAVQQGVAQFGQRIVFLGLRDPVGPFVRRTLDIAGIRDGRGHVMDPVVARRILPDPDLAAGGQIGGRVLRSDGSPVATPQITYSHSSPDMFGQCFERAITVKPGDDGGRYALDFVPGGPCGGAPFRIRARDPATGEEGELRAGIAANGQRLTLDIILVGRGTVQGTVRGPGGLPQPNVAVSAISETDLSTRTTSTDQNGFYRITGVAVGAFGLEARSASGSARASGLVLRAGSTTTLDLTIFGPADAVVAGQVRRPDGSPAASADVGIESSASPGLLASARTDAAGSFRFERIAPGGYRVRAIDRAAGQQGEALITVTADNDAENPAYVLVLLAGTGSVSGRITEIVNGAAVPVAGALVAGGLQIVTADSGGNYTIPAVPVGQRVIEAVNPQTGSRGSRAVTILTAGQVSQSIDIVLEPLARVTGRVLSPDGQPLAGQEVRIITGEGTGIGGRTFFVRRTQTAADGTYSFDQLEPRSYPLAAVRGTEVANGMAALSPLVLTSVVDLRLARPTGSVSGRVLDGTGLGIVAQVAVTARVPNAAGILEFRDAGTTTSDPDAGYRFNTLFPGPYAVTASSFFSPGTSTASGVLPEGNPTASNITLVLANNTGSLRGCVLAPDGSPIATVLGTGGTPLPLSVFITSVRLRSELADDGQNPNPDGIRVDASSGCFVSSIPLPPDYYTIEVTDDRTGSPTFGLRGQAQVTVAQGLGATQDVRLLGLGSVTVEVVDQAGHALRGVSVTLRRTTFPQDLRQAFAAAPTDTTPVVFADVTEGPVSLSATVSTDPGVDVGGRNELRGLGGHAVGVVVRNSSTPLRVVVDAAGVVTGRFLRSDRTTPVATAQVELHTSSRPTFYGVSDADGRFRFEGIPAGGFTMNGFDASTGRRAESTGHVEQDGQTVTSDLILGPLGRVLGVVLDATRSQPMPGADVRLSMAGVAERVVTAGVNGTFVFESVPGGTFTLEAVAPNGLSGQARGTLQTEGQEVTLELILEGSGRLEGTARDAFGAPVPAAQVTLLGRGDSGAKTVTAGASGQDTGRFVFDVVPLGPVTIEARPQGALTPGDGGVATGTLSTAGEGLTLDVTFDGTVTVGAVVTGTVGAAPIIVTLDSAGRFGGRTVPTTVENGVYLFTGVPRAPFTVSASQQTPVATTISASASILGPTQLPAAGGRLTPDIQLALSLVATVRGVVRLPDGAGASGARVTLTAGAFGSFALTASDGRFEFVGIPTGVALRLDIEGPSGGRASFVGSIDGQGNVRGQDGTVVTDIVLVLDVDPPRVLSVNPPSGSVGVPIAAPIVVTFTERIDAATLRPCTTPTSPGPISIRLLESTITPPSLNDPANACDDSNVVPVATTLSADGLTLTLTAGRPLHSQVLHVLTLSGPAVGLVGTPVGGIRDVAGLGMAADVTSTFVTRDAIPPAVMAISPAHGANNVARESLGRVTFSEPIDPATVTAANLRLAGASGPVPAQFDLILGNTVVVLTPIDGSGGRQLLASDATYTITLQNVRDVGGNTQAPAVATATFRTIDTIAPIIQSLTGPAGGRDGQFLELRAVTADADVAAVELFVDGVLQTRLTTPSAPGEYRGTIAMPGRTIHAAARAIDTTGNVGALTAPVAIPLLPDLPPSVTIVSPAPGAVVSPGTSVSITTRAEDDIAVTEVRAVVSGAVSATIMRTIEPPASPAVAQFDIAVPTDAPGGALTFAAVATDTKGQSSPAAVMTLSVADDIDPVVSITAPAAGTGILPGTTSLSVTVRAFDAGRVAEVSLQVPELSYSQTLPILPLASDVTRTFVLTIPSAFTQSALSLTASAKDRSGRTATATRTIAVLQSFAVASAATVGEPANAGAASANANQTIRITGQGLANTLVARFPTVDDAGTLGTATAPLFNVNTTATEGAVVVPTTAVTGSVRLETGAGAQAPGESLLQIVPTLTAYQLPSGTVALPGVTVTLTGSGFVSGATTVSFAESTPVPVVSVTNSGRTLTVVIPSGFDSGSIRALTSGGRSNELQVTDGFRVTSLTPINDATDVSLTTTVVIQLNRAADPATVTSTAVTLTAAGTVVPGATSVDTNGTTLTLTPSQPLAPDTRHTLTVSGLADLAGRQITPFESAFTTTPNVDLDPPRVTAVSPPDGAAAVPLDTVVQVTFNKPVNPATVTTSTFRLIETAAPATALVANGGFDTGATGWTIANVDGSGGWFASGGNPGGYFILNDTGSATDPTISQTISGLVVGRRYRVSGQYKSEYSSFGDPSALSFGVAVGGVLLGELARPTDSGWQPFAFDFTATFTSASLAVSAERNGDDSSYGVDNIAVEPRLDGSVVVAGDARSATFTPSAALLASRTYRVEVFGVTDTAGTGMTSPFASFFITSFIVGVDSDGDGFPDDVESEAGSSPLDPASTPISVQPPVTEAVSPPFSVLNTSNLAGTTNPALFVGQAASAPFAVLNNTNLSGTTNPVLFVGQATSAPFAVLNNTNLSDTPNPVLFVGQATSAPFAVLNNTDLSDTTNPALFIGQAVSPFFVVLNNPAAPDPQTTVVGRLVDSDGRPIRNAIVQVSLNGPVPSEGLPVARAEFQVRTNESGRFAITSAPANVPAIRVVDVGDVVVQRR